MADNVGSNQFVGGVCGLGVYLKMLVLLLDMYTSITSMT